VRARSGRERRLWTAAAALVAAIYGSAYFVQFALDFLRERNLLRLAIGIVFAVVAVVVVTFLRRAGAGARTWSTLALAGAVYLAVALWLGIVQERIHLIEYGALALLLLAALRERAGAGPAMNPKPDATTSPATLAVAFGLASAAGVGDELIQGALPNRVGELRDVLLNALSAALALGAGSALESALARDRGASGRRP
jgi:hypothetical protein